MARPDPNPVGAGFFVFRWWMRYDATCNNCGTVEITKLMSAEFPKQHTCGGTLTRLYGAPAVVYATSGFYTADTRFERSLTPERAARFAAQRDDAEKRAKAGRLTQYERGLEGD